MSENGFEGKIVSGQEKERKEEEERERREKQEKAVQELVDRLQKELEGDFELNITTDTFEVTVRSSDGSEKKEIFTRMGGKILVRENWYAVEKIIEARLRYPKENLSEALKKLEN